MHVAGAIRPVALRLAGLAFVLATWEFMSRWLDNPVRLPSLPLVMQAVRRNLFTAPGLELHGLSGGYLSNIVYTVSHALIAFVIGSTLGILIGVLSARLQGVRDSVAPFLILFGTVPALVAAPFILIWFGTGPVGQAVFVAFYAFVSVAIASQNAALQLPPRYEECAASLGASRVRRLATVVYPGALPSVIGVVRIALAVSLSLQVAVELLGSQQGAGRLIALSQSLAFTAGTVGVIILLAFFGLIIDAAVAGLLRYFTRWQEAISS